MEVEGQVRGANVGPCEHIVGDLVYTSSLSLLLFSGFPEPHIEPVELLSECSISLTEDISWTKI